MIKYKTKEFVLYKLFNDILTYCEWKIIYSKTIGMSLIGCCRKVVIKNKKVMKHVNDVVVLVRSQQKKNKLEEAYLLYS